MNGRDMHRAAGKADKAPDKRYLAYALRETEIARWRHQRCHRSTLYQAEVAVGDLEDVAKRILRVCDVTPAMVREATMRWRAAGKSASTINARLSTLSAMGVDCSGQFVPLPKRLKWWMSPDVYDRFAKIVKEDAPLRLYVDWAGATGFRIEESLRLTRSHFFKEHTAVTVPGSKTRGAQATLPLSGAATAIAVRAFRGRPDNPDTRMFPVRYEDLRREWNAARKALGITDPLATLKAMRRTAARSLTVNGMPLPILKQYLRHSNIATTMGYLHLTGGYSEEEMRKWL